MSTFRLMFIGPRFLEEMKYGKNRRLLTHQNLAIQSRVRGEFLGSVNTLINPTILKSLIYENPIQRNAGLDVYEETQKDHNYLLTVDVARGLGNDYSAFIVFDITEFPYKCVAKYRNNEIKPMLFPNIIFGCGKRI